MFTPLSIFSDTIILATVVILTLCIFIVANFLLYYIKRKNHFRQQANLEEKYEKEILATQLEIQEQTFKNISQEIHDNIGQALTLAKLNLNTMSAEDTSELKQKIINSKELVSKAINDLRDLSRSLNTDYVEEMGLIRSVEYELEMIKKSGSHATTLHIEGTVYRFEKQKELIIFRIAQEIFNNIIKHAEADKIDVIAAYTSDNLELTIVDNGQGFDLSPLNENNNGNFGIGIKNMHNRAKLVGAAFSMSSTIGEGTTVKISLPKENNNHDR